ncbi:hypothetical protein JY424_01035 [Stenotrophomonas maltophilia]|nr:hypothetical protein [Stenotrophomonas maltophilia]
MGIPRYFVEYGGWNSVFASKYFYAAAAVSGLGFWYFQQPKWWDLVTSVVPGLVGFAIAGVAIFVSLGSDALRSIIAGKEPGSNDTSPFIAFMAMFTHFIMVQLIALVLALVAKFFYETTAPPSAALVEVGVTLRPLFWWLGGLFFCYAVMLCLSLATEIFRLATMIDDFQTRENKYHADEAARSAQEASQRAEDEV